MSIRNPSALNNILSLVQVIYRCRNISTRRLSQEPYHGASGSRFSYGNSLHDGLRFTGANRGISTTATTNMVKGDDMHKVQPMLPPPRKPIFPKWGKWLLGSILSLMLPFLGQKWKNLLIFGGEVEKVIEEAENVAEVVEAVAIKAEKMLSEVAEKLPDGGKLKEAALFVEHVTSETAKDAELTKDFILKVEDVEHSLQDLGTMVEPVIDKIKHKNMEENSTEEKKTFS